MDIKDKIRVIGGNNELGQPTMLNKIGIISSFGTKYKVNGIDTIEVFVEFENFGTHCFNDYHLEKICSDSNCQKKVSCESDFCQFHCDNLPF